MQASGTNKMFSQKNIYSTLQRKFPWAQPALTSVLQYSNKLSSQIKKDFRKICQKQRQKNIKFLTLTTTVLSLLSALNVSSLKNVFPKHTDRGSHIFLYSLPLLFSLPKLYYNRKSSLSFFLLIYSNVPLFCHHSSLCSYTFQAVALKEMPLYFKTSLINNINVCLFYKHQNNSLWIRMNADNRSFLDIYINLQAWYLGLLTIHPGPLHFSISMEFLIPIHTTSTCSHEFSEYFLYKQGYCVLGLAQIHFPPPRHP